MKMNRSNFSILIVEDEPLIRKSLLEVLKISGYQCHAASNATEALEIIQKQKIDIILCDMKLPDVSGIELLRKVKNSHPAVEVVMMTGFGSVDTAVEAMKLKAFDYITKPIDDDEIKIILERITEKIEILQENRSVKKTAGKTVRQFFHGLTGASQEMQNIYNLIDSIASTKATVLITGESGTGKSIAARAIHECDLTRNKKPFVEVSCGALSESLLESELFGHVKGSFTGAIKDKPGRFEAACEGTIFLDEIDTCSPALQVKLLRILQNGTYERVGDNETRKTSARVIAATNQNLANLVDRGDFREDLYYRIHVIPIVLPSLRDRKEDLDLLVKYFIDLLNKKNNKKITGISRDVRELFLNYSWPGNVRQLENVLEGAIIMTTGEIINVSDLPKNFNARGIKQSTPLSSGEKSLKQGLEDPEKMMILKVLEEVHGNRSEAAIKLGINRTTLYNKLKKYGIE